jgi:hypothetical protein
VLKSQGPVPRATPAGQLTAAQESYLDQVLQLQQPTVDRQRLLQGLQRSDLVGPKANLTGRSDGQVLLVDLLDKGEGGGGGHCLRCGGWGDA